MELPKISAVTPVMNAERYIRHCIENVLSQSYPNKEHVIVDACSTDRTREIIDEYVAKDGNIIKPVYGWCSKGVGHTMNEGISHASGELICWLDSDDRQERYAMEKVAEYYMSHPEAGFIYGGCWMVDMSDKKMLKYPIQPFDWRKWVSMWVNGQPKPMILCNSAFFKRSLFFEVGGLDDLGNDLEFIEKIKDKTKLHMIPDNIGYYRYNPNSVSLKESPLNRYTIGSVVRKHREIAKKYHVPIMFPYRPRKLMRVLQPYLGWLYPTIGKTFVLISQGIGVFRK